MLKLVLFSSVDIPAFERFCQLASLEINQPAAENMWTKDWTHQSHTLMNVLLIQKRFDLEKGSFFVLYDNKNIVACSGIYKSDFCEDLAIAGCRTWINKEYRNKSIPRDLLLPAQKQWAIDNGIRAIALTFNEYNKNIIATFKRTRIGENAERMHNRQSHHLFYSNFNEVGFLVTIKHTPQWVIYERLDSSFEFNWQTIALT
jgi:GNAT superfamily N-acetyltransferase